MDRRTFLATTSLATTSAFALAGSAAPQKSGQFIKSICSVIFPNSVPLAERFKAAKNAGFDGIEVRIGEEIPLTSTADHVKQIGDAARTAGISIASVWVSEPFNANPLNSPDPEARARGVEALKKAIEFAPWLGCGALLIYPGRL